MNVNVALLPDRDLSRRIAGISRELGQDFGSSLVLDDAGGPFPHLTLYLTAFLDHSVATVPVLIQGSLEGLSPPRVHIRRGIVASGGTVLLVVEKTPALDHLHRWMIHKLNPFRMGAPAEFWEQRRDRYGPDELDRLDRIGFPQSLDAWSPHFTVGRVDMSRKREVEERLADSMDGYAPTIGVGTVGEHGTFTKILGKARF